MPKSKDSEFGIPPRAETRSNNVMEEIMEATEANKKVGESSPIGDLAEAGAKDHAHASPITIDTQAKLSSGPVIAVSLLAVLLAIFIALGIHGRSSAEAVLVHNTRDAAIESVSVVTPDTGRQAQDIKLPADTEGYIDTPIYARTNGYLLHWYTDIGASVHKGELLAVVQTPELDQQVEQAQEEVKTAQANEQIAEITANRWKKLMAKDAVSQQETDQAMSDLAARQSTLNSAMANVRRLQQMQGFEKIYAPFDGVITARNVDIGSLIQAGDINTQRGELFHLSAIDRLRLYVPVPEVYAGLVHNGGHLTVTSDALPNETFTGTVVRNADAIAKTSRTLNVEVDVENAKHSLLPGQYAFVHLPIPASTASMALPANTLLFRAEGLRVGVVREGQVHLTPIQIGNDYGATVEVTSGLQPTDKVILNPADSLAEGATVRIEGGQVQ
ncbi:efflux RND transporter periplasmic adaptor subunit [Edaphobacter modestus]|uniref:RND family efflux transporter MFP subunit n=1 Tax=Edaphobacter modestus TaxID=388466 RepID=A0A4Q7YSX9_9BACT|nr:efflux RND transporter periplasmic adaptor subunit [Edaphobacter modestus]RZU40364.1 RND family efflux transporter MFP subunit [Edaphobacter modestus]